MGEPNNRISFHKAWSIHIPGLKLVDFANDFHGFAVFDKDGFVRLFDQTGGELWSRKSPYPIVSLSLADTFEILAIDEEKYSILFGSEGATLWRKRPFPAAFARINASGESFSFVTTDPAIIGADRGLKVQWAYRNLMKRPADLAVSATSSVTAFPCCDDRGEGVGAVNQTGRPYDAFMGIEGVVSIDVSSDGQRVLALGSRGKVFCLDIVKGRGVWKAQVEGSYHGVSYADQTGESIVYSQSGRVVKFDAEGNQSWEYFFPDRLMKARILADGKSFYYASERGEVGFMTPLDENAQGSNGFREVEVKPVSSDNRCELKKVWNIELSGTNSSNAFACPWKGQEGVEYCLVWDGTESLFCINDLAEEIWKVRLSNTTLLDMSVSSEADMSVIVTKVGVAGYDLSGEEIFRFFGKFKKVHVFSNSSIILTDIENKCRFYQSADHFSHFIETGERVHRIIGAGDNALLQTTTGLFIVDSEGEVVHQYSSECEITYLSASGQAGDIILIGVSSGKVTAFDLDLTELFAHQIEGKVTLAGYNDTLQTLFVAADSEEIQILNRSKGEKTVATLTGKPAFVVYHEQGAVIGTELDQLGLLNSDGQLLVRYTSPYSLSSVFPCHRRMSVLVLSDEALSCIAAITGHS